MGTKIAANRGQNNKIVLLNLIMTLAITLFHWRNFYQLNVIPSQVSARGIGFLFNFEEKAGGVALSYFFFVSGYLLYRNMDSFAACTQKLKRRIFSLAVPLVAWNLLWFVYNVLFTYLYQKKTMDLSVLSILNGFTFNMYDEPLWYVLALILLLPFSLVAYRLKSKKTAGAILLLVITCFSYFYNLYGSSVFNGIFYIEWIGRVFYHLPCYALGAFMALCDFDFVFKENGKTVRAICGALAIAGLIYFTIIAEVPELLNWLIKKLIAILLIVAVSNKNYNKVICYTSKRAFYIFAMHQPMIGIFNTILYRLVGKNNLTFITAFLIHLVMLALLCAVAFAFSWVCERLLPKKARWIFSGGR